MSEETKRTEDQILAGAGIDTGFTKGGGFTIDSKVIEKIVKAIKDKGKNLSLSPSDFATLIKKDVSKSKNPVSALQTAFNKSVTNDYPVYKKKGLKASIRRQQGKDITTTVNGKTVTVKEGLIALCMDLTTQEDS